MAKRQEFTPSPSETWSILEKKYCVRKNVIVRFESDPVDQSLHLKSSLDTLLNEKKVDSSLYTFPGTHLQPNRLLPDWTFLQQLVDIILDIVQLGVERDGSGQST